MSFSYLKFGLGTIVVIAAVGYGSVRAGYLAQYVDNAQNVVVEHEPYAITPDAQKVHDQLRIADLHNDVLLWGRNLSSQSSIGHSDLPRFKQGNVGVQIFSSVTKSPRGQNYEQNSTEAFDNITLLGWAQSWPSSALNSLSERALLQAQRLYDLERDHPESVKVVHNRGELEATLTARASGSDIIAGVLGTEGGHALDGDIKNVDRLYDGGLRMMGLQHFFDNKLGGSLHGQSKAGLTDFGKEVVRLMEEKEMIVDLAHSSPAVIKDVLAMSSRPVVVSHTGVRGICNTPRNLTDTQVREISAKGGLIGIGFWDAAACDISPKGVANSIDYAVSIAGIDHVALGSDFDGAVTTAFDTSEYAVLAQELMKKGFTQEQIAAVMGENIIRFLLENLPQGKTAEETVASSN
ncbi:Membrane dipeptidase (Peptidase family M19) [Pseudovibrio axinellae]|uniref:Membrane dipeptidase (Peptidase family M19) n=1 Tax=Pseudovibrio axinellae TaxID=989403 RepID=A0A165ZRD0_9HYPH|nr:dipeptidase [Pseudovibrio axinellae]KZL20199.1 Membrane dipeptidase (Peptidase family M19) [Pseudovibrio axinellae]SEQ60625.1 Zn-dependent dipeptidase, dipeptidase homolog [Pseudovibrio axinellae]